MHDAIVIGGGPSGMTAALYLLRAGKTVLVLEREAFGGQIAKSPRLENFPSIKSISGLEFSDNLFTQITDLGAEFELEDVKGVTKVGNTFIVTTDYGIHESRTVILANGCHHKALGLPREEELTGHGISYCATCDGAFFQGQEVLLIGDANTAAQYAIELSNLCKKVTICTLFDHFFCDNILLERIKNTANIVYYHNLSAKEFLGDEDLTGVKFENTQTHEEVTFSCAGCFIAIGYAPCNEPFASLVDLEKGFILTNEAMETKTPGLFAAGDCRAKGMRQVVTATNDGALAAVSAAKYLQQF